MRAIYFQKSIPRVVATLALKKLWADAVYSPLSPVQFKEVGEGRLEGPRWIRVRNRVCGICASDLHLVFVDVDPKVHPAALPGFERIYLGHEVVSEVVEVGPEVRSLKVGDRVLMKSRFLGPTCHSQEIEPVCRHCAAGNYAICANQSAGLAPAGVGGGWAEGYTCHESEVWKAPDDLDDDAVSLIEPIACGVRAVLRKPPQPGDKVLIIGCGMIGLGTIQALRALFPEVHVYAAARYPQQVERAQAWGATVIGDRDLLAAAVTLTGAKLYQGEFNNRTLLGGFDQVYDCVGNDATIEQSLRLARAGGTVIVVGVHLHRIQADLTPTWHQEVDLIGALAHGAEHWQGKRQMTYELTAQLLRAGQLTTDGLITHRFKLDQWREAIRTAVDKRSGAIKVVFDF